MPQGTIDAGQTRTTLQKWQHGSWNLNKSSKVLVGLTLTCCLAACGNPEPSTNGNLPANKVPTGRIPSSQIDLFALVSDLNIQGIQAHFIGAEEHTLLLLHIDSNAMEPVLLGVPKGGISAHDAMLQNNLSVVIGSGFVAELQTLEPVGLLQIEGRTLSPVQGHGYTRILGINDDGIGVVHREAYQRDLFHSALQAGPGIIEQGELDISERDLQRPKYFRSFVAVCESGWLAGVSLAPSHLRTLGQTLLQHIRASGMNCDDVVNLAGDRQAVLLLQTHEKQVIYHGDPNTHKVSVLGFRPLSL
jgi:hypothetical protein